MEQQAHANPAPAGRPRRSALGAALVVSALLLAGSLAVGVYAYVALGAAGEADSAALLADYARRFGPRAKLDESLYADADGDLVADVPADPTQRLDPPRLVLTWLTFEDPEKAKAIWSPLVEHLTASIGRPVEYDPSLKDAEAQLAALRDGKLHVTAFSTGAVSAAVNTAGFVPFAAPADEGGTYAYRMEIIVPVDSPVRSPKDLKGRQVTFSGMASNAGMKAPMYLLHEELGLRPGRDYTFNFSGSYRESIKGVAAGRYQAAPIASDVLRREMAHGLIKSGQVRSVYASGEFPPWCFGHAHRLDPVLTAKLRRALLAFPWKGTPVERELGASGASRFVEVSYRRDWAFVRAIDEGMLKLAGQ